MIRYSILNPYVTQFAMPVLINCINYQQYVTLVNVT